MGLQMADSLDNDGTVGPIDGTSGPIIPRSARRVVNDAVRSLRTAMGEVSLDGYKSLGPIFKLGTNAFFNNGFNSGGGTLLAGTNLNFFNSSPTHDDIMGLIFHVDPTHQRKHILDTWADGKVVSGTCHWLELLPQYKTWLTSLAPQAMWLTGRPGMGKTFLSVYLTQQLQARVENKGGGTVVWYFFDSENKLQSTAEGALRSMIWMMCHKNPGLLQKYIIPEMADRGVDGDRFTFELWWTIFEKIIAGPESGEVYCILDGLNNCKEPSFHNLLVKLKALYLAKSREPESPPRFRLIVVSQPCPTLFSYLSGFQHLDLEESDDIKRCVKGDILRFIDYKVDGLNKLRESRRWSENFPDFMRGEFIAGAGIDFLWVGWVAKTIELDGSNEKEAKNLLANAVPIPLEKLYNQMVHRIDNLPKMRKQLGRRILRTILYACRPLTLGELGVLVGEDSKDGSLDEHMKERIKSCCGYMLNVGKVVTFYHPTTIRLFLEKKFANSKGDTHVKLCQICFECIARWAKRKSLRHQDDQEVAGSSSERIDASLSANLLVDYAIRYWPEHLRLAGAISQTRDKLRKEIFESPTPQIAQFWSDLPPERDAWLKEYWRLTMPYWMPPMDFRPIHFAAYFGLEWRIRDLLDDKNILTVQNIARLKTNFGMTALHWAARNGHISVIDTLLEWPGLRLDLEGEGYKMTPLHWAVLNNRLDISKSLIDKRAKVEAIAFGKTPLHWAICDGNKALVELLLDHKANIEARVVPNDINPAVGILSATFAAISWTNMPSKSARNESQADIASVKEWRECVQKSENALRWTVKNASILVSIAFIAASYLLISTLAHLRLLLESLGWELNEFISAIAGLLSMWLGIGLLYKIGQKSLAATGAIMLCAGWAGLLSGQAVMLVAATVCCSPDEMMKETIMTFSNFVQRWGKHITTAIVTLSVVQIWLVGVTSVVFFFLWAIFLSLWAALPGVIVWVNLASQGTKEWAILAIPFLGFAVVALVSLVAHLVTYGNGATGAMRWRTPFLAFVCAGLSGGLLIWLKPVPTIAESPTAHVGVTFLGAVWSFFGVFLSIIIAEAVIFAPQLWRLWQITFGRGLQDPTALMLAVQYGNIDIVRSLLKHEARIDAKDAKGRSAVDLAETFQKQEILDLLRRLEYKKSSGRSSLFEL